MSYALVTLHRPSNVDALDTLAPIVEELVKVSRQLPILFAAHPRTIKGFEKFDPKDKFTSAAKVKLLNPLPYVQFMNIVTAAKLVITDSGGLQEETTYLRISCLTMRENTERPVTITQGTNRLVRAILFVDTDCVLAIEYPINWSDYMPIVDESELHRLPNARRDFHFSVGPAHFGDLQQQCRKLWEEWLSPRDLP